MRLKTLSLCLILAGCGSAPDAPGAKRVEAITCPGPLSPVSRILDPASLAVDFTRPTANDGVSTLELELYALIEAHREKLGLPSISLSRSLTLVAGRHAEDSAKNLFPNGLRPGTNMHSWSDVDYYEDHRNAAMMWEAPRRLGTSYCSAGFEISTAGHTSAAAALNSWLGSPPHREVIENTGTWSDNTWRAIGIGYAPSPSGYYRAAWHVWFGEDPDPAGKP